MDARTLLRGHAKIIHEYSTAEDAVRSLANQRGRDMDFLTKVLLPR